MKVYFLPTSQKELYHYVYVPICKSPIESEEVKIYLPTLSFGRKEEEFYSTHTLITKANTNQQIQIRIPSDRLKYEQVSNFHIYQNEFTPGQDEHFSIQLPPY